jgi:hypothetical protein
MLQAKNLEHFDSSYLLFQNLHDISPACPAVDSAPAEVQIINRRFMIRPAWDGPHEHELVEHE